MQPAFPMGVSYRPLVAGQNVLPFQLMWFPNPLLSNNSGLLEEDCLRIARLRVVERGFQRLSDSTFPVGWSGTQPEFLLTL